MSDKEDVLEINLLKMNQLIEKQIKKRPYQWSGWLHNRWRDKNF